MIPSAPMMPPSLEKASNHFKTGHYHFGITGLQKSLPTFTFEWVIWGDVAYLRLERSSWSKKVRVLRVKLIDSKFTAEIVRGEDSIFMSIL